MHGHGKAHDGGEEVRHGLYSEGAAAGLGEALGDRQSQAGAAIRAALVTPHKPGGEVHTFRQLIAGGIANGGDCRLVGGFQREVDAAPRQAVIEGILKEILEHPVQARTVGRDLYGLHQVGMQSSSSLQIARYF